MANVTIRDLPQGTTPAEVDQFVYNDDGVDKRITRSDLEDNLDVTNSSVDSATGTQTVAGALDDPSRINPEAFIFASRNGVSSSNTQSQNTTALESLINSVADNTAIVIPSDVTIDWDSITLHAENVTIISGEQIIVGNVGLKRHYSAQNNYISMQTQGEGNTTRVYIEPNENPLGENNVNEGIVSSVTVFGDAYTDQFEESTKVGSNWTGAHYRDGGVSFFQDRVQPYGDNMVPEYLPAGLVAFNAKTGGNWWPFRPGSGLSVSERPLATAMQLQPSPALAGPTFAGGGVYPTYRWQPGKSYSVGDICHEYGRVYEVVTAGTSGDTPPLHDGSGGARADAWDASILTTTGTLNGSFYEGTDSGGEVVYALVEQMYPTTMDRVLQLGDALAQNPVLGLGDSTQLTEDMYMAGELGLIAVKKEADGSGTVTGPKIFVDFNGAFRIGYDGGGYILVPHNSTNRFPLVGAAIEYAEKVKSDGATEIDGASVNIVKINDSAATNVTGIVNAKQGQEITVIFNNSNTTLVHSANFRLGAAATNITPGSNEAYKFIMRSDTVAQLIG